jgi:Holliday junction DNA helicase RuvA
MIGRLRGTVLHCSPQEVVLDVGGVGYLLRIPLSTFYSLSGRGKEEVAVHVHTHVREDALQLFGFATVAERAAFERLIAISGVGPKLALSVLSGIDAQELDRTVETGDRVRLERIPGVGRKTAERILLELKGRPEGSGRGKRRSSEPVEPATPERGGEVRWEATSALLNLGYPRDAAERAVESALGAPDVDGTIEEVLKRALRALLR